MSAPNRTLRERLLRAVLAPALVVVAVSAVFDYVSALDLSQQAQDSLLLKTATALATRLSPDEDEESVHDLALHLAQDDLALLTSDPVDDIHLLALTGRGEFIAGDASLVHTLGLSQVRPSEAPRYRDGTLGGAPVRIITLAHRARGAELKVLVAETNRKRMAAARKILFNAVWPNLLLLVVMLALMYRGIGRALAPLKDLGTAIDQRARQDLDPVATTQVPGEVRPLVTAINGMLARLQKATSEQQMFLTSAAHQLRTPLAGIRTQLELAARDKDAPAIHARLQRLLDAVQRLAHSTQQMLTLARSSANASTVHDFNEVDLPALVEDGASNWLDPALQARTELCFELEPARITGSAWMLQEMLGNLIENAIKHSPAEGRVTVRCGTDANQAAYLEVEDLGPGIAQAERDKVFEPFYRSPQARADGSGLGLSIVREVASRHGASVDFVGGTDHAGTLIRVSFRAASSSDA